MNFQYYSLQADKLLRAMIGTALIAGPYVYTIAQPEKSLDYRFTRPKDEDGKFLRAHPAYNRIATEMALRMKIQEQMRRNSTIDIRTTVHTGLEFDSNGNFTPVFNGIVYLVIPQWANLSSIDDLKKLKIKHAGIELDFSKINYSMLNMEKIKIGDMPDEKIVEKPVEMEKEKQKEERKEEQSNSFFSRWFGSKTTVKVSEPNVEPPKIETPIVRDNSPISRESILLERLIETFNLSENAKRYIIADQIEIGRGPWHVIPWFIVASSFFMPFTLYTRFRTRFQTRFKRFLYFHFLLLNGIVFFYFSPIIGRAFNMQASRIRDSSSASYGLDILEGGIEFLEKQKERNRILRELLPQGRNIFDEDGERKSTRVVIPNTNGFTISLHHWEPLINYRLKRLRKKLDHLLSLPEHEARKEIFKSSI